MDQFEPRPLMLTPDLYSTPHLFTPMVYPSLDLPPQYNILVASLTFPADLQDGLRVKRGMVLVKSASPPPVTSELGWEWLEERHREAKATNQRIERLLINHRLRIMYSGRRFRTIPGIRYFAPNINPDDWSLTLQSVEVLK